MTAGVWIAIGVYALLGLGVALASRRRLGTGVAEHDLAGRRVGGVVSALSYGATTYSAFMMVGLAGLTYAGGVGALGFELIYLAGLGLVVIFGPRFWLVGRARGHITPSEMLGDRYDSRALAGLVATRLVRVPGPLQRGAAHGRSATCCRARATARSRSPRASSSAPRSPCCGPWSRACARRRGPTCCRSRSCWSPASSRSASCSRRSAASASSSASPRPSAARGWRCPGRGPVWVTFIGLDPAVVLLDLQPAGQPAAVHHRVARRMAHR
ncbi:MAG: hypothetical protein U5K43_10160 [Halofilum sp. (in: g-proteobacteria)]|nr:hypothetical protein [Halofilum sp. (in: g-proteobacteria)]